METESLQVARFYRHPELLRHYQAFQAEITAGLASPANNLLFQLCVQNSAKINGNPEKYLDDCIEDAFKWVNEAKEEKNGKRVSSTQLVQKCQAIREGIAKQESGIEAEERLRDWLQRNIVSNASAQEPTINGKGQLEDPFLDASEKIACLNAVRLFFIKEGDELSFPLANTKLESKPRIPIGLDPLDQLEFTGGPEFDSLLTLCGETNVGKSHMGLFFLSTLNLQRKTVLMVSGEDSPAENKKRLLAHFMRMSDVKVLTLSEKERTLRMRELYGHEEDPESLHFHIQNRFSSVFPDEGQLTPLYISDRKKRLEDKTQTPVEAMMVDYLQKGKPTKVTRNMQRDEELEVFTNELKELGEDSHFTVLISQIPSHAAGGAKAEFLNLKQATARSYAATWGAHYIITINRTEEEFNRLGSSSDKRPRLNLFLCKNKNGPIGTCHALGLPAEARWRFFRTKNELLRVVAQ